MHAVYVIDVMGVTGVTRFGKKLLKSQTGLLGVGKTASGLRSRGQVADWLA